MDEPLYNQSQAPGGFRRRVIFSLFWKYGEVLFAGVITFAVSIILARLLGPTVVGTVALLMVFIEWAKVCITSGFSMALIRKSEIDETDCSSVFYVTSAIAVFLYLLLFALSPFIARLYKLPELTRLLRVLALMILPSGFAVVQDALVMKTFRFRAMFFRTLVALVLSGGVGIWMALTGCGIWSLVAQNGLYAVLSILVLSLFAPWRPHLLFSWTRIRELFSFGGRILFFNITDSVYQEMYTLVIGKRFNTDMLGFYNKGRYFPSTIAGGIISSSQAVMLPAFSTKQNDILALRSLVRRCVSLGAFIGVPLFIGLAAVAEPLVSIFLGNEWLPSVPFLQIYCLTQLWLPVQITNGQALYALGRSDITLRNGLIQKPIGFAILFLSLHWGIHAVAWGAALNTAISGMINAVSIKRLINYGALEQLRDSLSALLLSAVMFLVASLWRLTALPAPVLLLVQIITGFVTYILLAKLFRVESYTKVIHILQELLGRDEGHRA